MSDTSPESGDYCLKHAVMTQGGVVSHTNIQRLIIPPVAKQNFTEVVNTTVSATDNTVKYTIDK
jgi:hypothetical protein